jgi:hypothetical protein
MLPFADKRDEEFKFRGVGELYEIFRHKKSKSKILIPETINFQNGKQTKR